MSAKHTPGPWKAAYDGESWGVYADGARQGSRMPAECCYGPDAEGNARLIAAAPALADALVDALEFADEGWRNITEDRERFDWIDVERRRELIRAALRAAGRLP